MLSLHTALLHSSFSMNQFAADSIESLFDVADPGYHVLILVEFNVPRLHWTELED